MRYVQYTPYKHDGRLCSADDYDVFWIEYWRPLCQINLARKQKRTKTVLKGTDVTETKQVPACSKIEKKNKKRLVIEEIANWDQQNV